MVREEFMLEVYHNITIRVACYYIKPRFCTHTVADSVFSHGAPIPDKVRKPIIVQNFRQKLHEND